MKSTNATLLALGAGLAGGAAVTVALATALGPVFEASCEREGRSWCGFEGALSAGFYGLLAGAVVYLLIGLAVVHQTVDPGARTRPLLVVLLTPITAFLGLVVLAFASSWL